MYKAEDARLERAVALKFLPLELGHHRDAKDCLVHEAGGELKSQLPMFEGLGSAAEGKRHVLYPGGHLFPLGRIKKDTLERLDRRFGPTQQLRPRARA